MITFTLRFFGLSLGTFHLAIKPEDYKVSKWGITAELTVDPTGTRAVPAHSVELQPSPTPAVHEPQDPKLAPPSVDSWN